MTNVALIGWGELGAALAPALARLHPVVAWSRPRPGLGERITVAGATPATSLQEAVEDADVVLCALPPAVAPAVALDVLGRVRSGALLADLASSTPEQKQDAARVAARGGVSYADAAVLGTVAASGASVPIVAAGDGAERLAALLRPARMRIDVIGGEAGRAARLKLVRSVFMKGRDALVLETMLAARRHGLESEVARSISGPGEDVPFPALVERVLTGLAVHAERRADELDACAALLRESGIEPIVTDAGTRRLRDPAVLGLRERLRGERPASGSTTLDAIERAAATPAGPAPAEAPSRPSPRGGAPA